MRENNTFKEELFFGMWDYLKYLCGGLYPEWQSGSNTTKLFDKHGNLLIEYRDKIKKNHTALSRWYKDYADKDDMNEVYDFFKVAFDKDKLNHALEVGSDEAIMDFLRHAYDSADISTTDHNLNMGLEVIHDILNDQKEQQQ